MARKSDDFGADSNDETVPLIGRPQAARKPKTFRRCCCTSFLIVLTVLFLACCVLAALLNIDLGKSVADSGTSLDSPGVGFDLGPDYATAAVRARDGANTGVARVSYDADWVEMMRRMSEEQYLYGLLRFSRQYFKADLIRSSDPWRDYCSDPWGSYKWENIRKRIRRNLGLPSTQDVARLAKILEQLKGAAEKHLQSSVVFVHVAVPMFPQICPDHLEEAAQLNGMATIELAGYHTQLHELEAAYAGYGMGLCQDYMNSTSCRAEEEAMPSSSTLMISYTDTAFILDWYRMSKIRYQPRDSLTYRTNWSLGSSDAPQKGSQEAEAYWQRLSVAIIDFMTSYQVIMNGTQADKLLLVGESSNHADFKSVVQDTMLRLQRELPVMYDNDSIYVAAKGAAELAKREEDLTAIEKEQKRTKAI